MNDYCVGYRDFVQQETGTDEDKRLRPDLVVKLPNNKNIVVDAKAILEAYVDSLQMPDGGQRLDKLKEHARLNRDHLANLGQKMCWKQFAPTPNLSSCFLPGEVFRTAACHLHERAKERHLQIGNCMS